MKIDWHSLALYSIRTRKRRGALNVFRSAGGGKGIVTIRLKQNRLLAHCGPPRKHRNVQFQTPSAT